MADETSELSAFHVLSINKLYLSHMACTIRFLNIEEIKGIKTFE